MFWAFLYSGKESKIWVATAAVGASNQQIGLTKMPRFHRHCCLIDSGDNCDSRRRINARNSFFAARILAISPSIAVPVTDIQALRAIE